MYVRTWKKPTRIGVSSVDRLEYRTKADSICLPFQIQTAVPACALNCIQDFIVSNYGTTSCSSTSSIDYLCTTKTSSGLTIGEGNLQCVISSCPESDHQTESGYHVCDNLPPAIESMTQTTTATVSASSTPPSNATSTLSTATTSLPQSSANSVGRVWVNSAYNSTWTIAAISLTTPLSSASTSSLWSSWSSLTDESSASTASGSTSALFSTAGTSTTFQPSSTASATTTSDGSSTTASSVSDSTTTTTTANPSIVKQSGLTSSAIAGIAAASIVASIFFIIYVAFALCMRKRKKERQNNQQPPDSFPRASDNTNRPNSMTGGNIPNGFRIPAMQHPMDRPPRNGRESFQPRPEVGANATPMLQHFPTPPVFARQHQNGHESGVLWPAAAYVQDRGLQRHPAVEQNRWSHATSFDEEAEMRDQDLPALADPIRNRSYSMSSGTIEMPTPLRIDPSKANNSSASRVQLTPTYDNGNYEPFAMQAIIPPIRMMRPDRTLSTRAPNFSRKEPASIRSPTQPPSPAMNAPTTTTSARPVHRKLAPPPPGRKSSTLTNDTLSVYTEIEEDSTPEQEDDKQLKPLHLFTDKNVSTPLRDIRYPKIPRSATIKRQAEKPHSPRALHTTELTNRTPGPHPSTNPRIMPMGQRQTFLRSDTPSDEETSQDSECPTCADLPPPTTETKLTRKISNAVQKAAIPTTAVRLPMHDPFTDDRYTPQPYQKPIFLPPRTSSLANRAASVTRPPLMRRNQNQIPLPRSDSRRVQVPPPVSSGGSMYFTVDDLKPSVY